AHEVGRLVVEVDVGDHAAPGGQEAGAADAPELLEALAALLGRRGQGVGGVAAETHARALHHRDVARVHLPEVFDVLVARGRIVGRPAEIGRAVEDGDVRGLLGDRGDRLDARRAGADHRHALAGEVDAFVWPGAGVVSRAFEALDARNR